MRLRRLKTEGEKLRTEMRERTAGYVMSGLGVVVGLAWNEAIKAFIEYSLPFASAGTMIAKFIYAVILTILIVIVATYVVRAPIEKK